MIFSGSCAHKLRVKGRVMASQLKPFPPAVHVLPDKLIVRFAKVNDPFNNPYDVEYGAKRNRK